MKLVSSLSSRTQAAKTFVRDPNYWIAVAGTDPWIDESEPPLPSPSMIALPSIYGFWYVHRVRLVAYDANGSIVIPQGRYRYVKEDEDLISVGATQVYLEAAIIPLTLTRGISYRALGLCSNLVVSKELSNVRYGSYLLAQDVVSYELDLVATFPPITPMYNETHVIQLIKEF